MTVHLSPQGKVCGSRNLGGFWPGVHGYHEHTAEAQSTEETDASSEVGGVSAWSPNAPGRIITSEQGCHH